MKDVLGSKTYDLTEMRKLFLKEKPAIALLAIEESPEDKEIYGSVVSKKIDATYAHTTKILDRMEDLGLIAKQSHGRKKTLETTEKGSKVAKALDRVFQVTA